MWRPQNFAKSPPIICPMYCESKNWWGFRKFLWPSQNIWTLKKNISIIFQMSIIMSFGLCIFQLMGTLVVETWWIYFLFSIWLKKGLIFFYKCPILQFSVRVKILILGGLPVIDSSFFFVIPQILGVLGPPVTQSLRSRMISHN